MGVMPDSKIAGAHCLWPAGKACDYFRNEIILLTIAVQTDSFSGCIRGPITAVFGGAVATITGVIMDYWKRMHDLNLKGWVALLGLIPLVNIPFAIMAGFIKGTDGENNFGPDPTVPSNN